MQPPGTQGTRGEAEGQPTRVYRDVPCSIEPLRGGEADRARTVFAEASLKVELYADPRKRITPGMYLTGGSLGQRVLNIGYIEDARQNGEHLVLVCGEEVAISGDG
jgi:head-tail adaptor